MAKSEKQIEAHQLRQGGESIKEIAKVLAVSKSTVSLWCRDIELTSKQIQRLHENMVAGGYRGRLKGARIQKERKERKIEYYLREGRKTIKPLNRSELLIAGLSLYWGEGGRKSPGVRFYNSDPDIVKFIIKWFKIIFKITNERFLIYIMINEIHRDRLNDVKRYWIKITGIPERQFRKIILIKAKNKKVYENFNQYFGTLNIRLTKSTDLYYRIMGLIKALN